MHEGDNDIKEMPLKDLTMHTSTHEWEEKKERGGKKMKIWLVNQKEKKDEEVRKDKCMVAHQRIWKKQGRNKAKRRLRNNKGLRKTGGLKNRKMENSRFVDKISMLL